MNFPLFLLEGNAILLMTPKLGCEVPYFGYVPLPQDGCHPWQPRVVGQAEHCPLRIDKTSEKHVNNIFVAVSTSVPVAGHYSLNYFVVSHTLECFKTHLSTPVVI